MGRYFGIGRRLLKSDPSPPQIGIDVPTPGSHTYGASDEKRATMRLLPNLLSRFVKNGRLTVIFEDGFRQAFGSGQDGPDVTIRLTDKAVEREIFFNPELKAAEAYMDGRLVIENGGKHLTSCHFFLSTALGWQPTPFRRRCGKSGVRCA
ncbi:hypothetical protein SAMN05428953_1201, partial [Mesorhizobium muleiense]